MTHLPFRQTLPQRLPIYYGWINVLVASVAMTATLPGRTHGLGLITEPLLKDLAVDRVWFAHANFIASLIGSAFCIPAGWLIDRYGVRSVLSAILGLLGFAVLGLSQAATPAILLITLVFVRGLGQSALSVASMACIGKWFRRRLGLAMGLFAVLLMFGFIGSVLGMGEAIERMGWRDAWQTLGIVLLALTPAAWLVTRSTPASCGLPFDAPVSAQPAAHDAGFTLRQALATPAFWIVALGTSAFNLVWSAVTLFNESMLAERGLNREASIQIMAILTGAGLIANLACGKLATRSRIPVLLAAGLLLLAVSLTIYPQITTLGTAQLYAAAIGLSGGIITVVFFAAWGHLFGESHLGRIQGAAQFATVIASALGPELMAQSLSWTGSYTLISYLLAALTAALAIAAFLTPLPPKFAGPQAEPVASLLPSNIATD